MNSQFPLTPTPHKTVSFLAHLETWFSSEPGSSSSPPHFFLVHLSGVATHQSPQLTATKHTAADVERFAWIYSIFSYLSSLVTHFSYSGKCPHDRLSSPAIGLGYTIAGGWPTTTDKQSGYWHSYSDVHAGEELIRTFFKLIDWHRISSCTFKGHHSPTRQPAGNPARRFRSARELRLLYSPSFWMIRLARDRVCSTLFLSK